MNVGGAVDEVLREAVSDGGDRAHAARTDNHTACQKRAAGNAGREVAVVVIVQSAPPRRRRRFVQHVSRIAQQFVRIERIQPHFAVQFVLDHFRPGEADRQMDVTAGATALPAGGRRIPTRWRP